MSDTAQPQASAESAMWFHGLNPRRHRPQRIWQAIENSGKTAGHRRWLTFVEEGGRAVDLGGYDQRAALEVPVHRSRPSRRRHGAKATYNTGCRCGPCRAANTAASREWRQSRVPPDPAR